MKILFVCTGNICRSPLAEGIFRSKALRSGIEAITDSCGFERFHVGDLPDPRAQKFARDPGIDISGHRGRLFSVADFDRFDRIYVMDEGHYRNVQRLARNNNDLKKADFFMNVLAPGKNLSVEDPWYGTLDDFYTVYDQLEKGCDAIIQDLIHRE